MSDLFNLVSIAKFNITYYECWLYHGITGAATDTNQYMT